MSNRNIILLVVLAGLTLLVYTIDLFKLNYRLTDWSEFGVAPVPIAQVQYFVADTPNIISYHDINLDERVTCFESLAYLETDTQENYRCCNTVDAISCLEGDFSTEIPPVDDQCIAELKEIFGVPDTLEGVKEYQVFGECLGGRFAELTVVQRDEDGAIRWKNAKVDIIQVLTSTLRCVVGPALLAVIFYILYKFYQEKTSAPVRRI